MSGGGGCLRRRKSGQPDAGGWRRATRRFWTIRAACGTGDGRRSGPAAAVGLEKPRQAGGGAEWDEACGQRNTVRKLLTGLGFSRQSNRKADEGSHHADRDAQFDHINAKVLAARAAGQPVISVGARKRSWWQFSQRRQRLPAEGRAAACERARFRGQKSLARLCPMASTISWLTLAG